MVAGWIGSWGLQEDERNLEVGTGVDRREATVVSILISLLRRERMLWRRQCRSRLRSSKGQQGYFDGKER